MRLIVVSNRVACPKGDEPIEGGLAAALVPAVKTSGAIWVGSSRRQAGSTEKEGFAQMQSLGRGAVVTVGIPNELFGGFYEGFANSALWPAFHSRADLIRTKVEHYVSYREVNALIARPLLRLARPDAMFWVHDYHFLTMASELRKLGIAQPIGFFFHTPFPSRDVILSLPYHSELIQAMLSYDLIGFQTDADLENFADYLQQELKLTGNDNVFTTNQGATRLACFPIGIDVEQFAEQAATSANQTEPTRLRSSLEGSKLVIGVDRVDYSKGLLNRLRAFDQLLRCQPELKRAVTLLQIGVPSRGKIPVYRQLQGELGSLVGDINGRHSDVDWIPIRYLNKGFSRPTLAGFYRAAHVGLVTSLNDGMNLVAKEYVAAQDARDPGVLVLSRFTGAAKQLDAAVLVNPHDIDAVARALAQALAMPSAERRERWDAMMEILRSSSLDMWFSDFVSNLAECPRAERSAWTPDVAAQPIRSRQLELTAIP